jgi:hypothetical protein
MIQLKNNLSKIVALLLFTIIIVGFNKKHFVLNGGTINNPTISIPANTEVPEITATNASGCADTLTYQWQQSSDGTNFNDLPNATGAFCRPGRVMSTTHFRRKAICSSGEYAYTTNVATILLVIPSP